MATRKSGGRKETVDPMTVEELFTSAVKAAENARDLVRDAELLLEHQRYPRAFSLAEFAREEITKPPFYLGAALQIVLGDEPDWGWLDDRLRDHRAKIEAALFIDYLHEPHANVEKGIEDLVSKLLASGKTNDLKNYSIYASHVDGRPVKPPEMIDAKLATEWVRQARDGQRRIAAMISIFVTAAGTSGERLQELALQLQQNPEAQGILQWYDRMTGEFGDESNAIDLDKLRQMLTDPETQYQLSGIPEDSEQLIQAISQALEATKGSEQSPT